MRSVYEAVDYESNGHLRRYKKRLKKINQLGDQLTAYTDTQLRELVPDPFDQFNKQHVDTVMAIAREVTWRLLGKKHYDVQVIGGLACMERNMVQMRTGSGKTLTLILPVVCYGLTHKGCHVLTVNDYLSERDWLETKPVYDWFGLTSAFVSTDHAPELQRDGFDCDITYCTNSTLGFAYLHSALANGYDGSIKALNRPLHVAIIDEADEILMDDAINPLIIAQGKDMSDELSVVDYYGEKLPIQYIVDTLKHVRTLGYADDSNRIILDDKAYQEIIDLLNIDERVFAHPQMMFVIHNAIQAIFNYKVMNDYVVSVEPDEDSGSRIILIDKATGRLANGRTLNDSLHAFVEMKEHVFTGSGSTSSLQITYQTLFNIYPIIAGVTGTLGLSFQEFTDIYRTGLVVVPDRVPHQLKHTTHLYETKAFLMDDVVRYVKMYTSSKHPILIGTSSDIEVDMVAQYLTNRGLNVTTLLSTDTDEEIVVRRAGEPGSIVITTDIMGRGTDIHVERHSDRGLVVLQIGLRNNTRIEFQLAGRAGRQGLPGRYHRFVAVPELKNIGYGEEDFSELNKIIRENRGQITKFHDDILFGGRIDYYDEIVDKIDYYLTASESATSSQRVQDFKTNNVIDIIQTGLLARCDRHRDMLKTYLETADGLPIREEVVRLSIPNYDTMRKRKLNKLIAKKLPLLDKFTDSEVADMLAKYVHGIVHTFVPLFRTASEAMIETVQLGGMIKRDGAPESFLNDLVNEFLEKNESLLVIQLESEG